MPLKQNKARAKQDYDEVYEAGKQAEYDAFWDNFQENGTRTHYPHGFSWWDGKAFNPKYPIKIKDIRTWTGSGDNIFEGFNNKSIYGNSEYEMFDMSGFDIDFSGCNRIALPLAYACLKNMYLDLSNCTRIQQIFGAGNYVTYCDNITLKLGSTKNSALTNPLYGIHNTTTLMLTEDSIIDSNGWDLQTGKKLSRQSIESFINVLSTATSGLTITFSLEAVNKAYETSTGANDGSTSTEWLALVATKPNWTIALA